MTQEVENALASFLVDSCTRPVSDVPDRSKGFRNALLTRKQHEQVHAAYIRNPWNAVFLDDMLALCGTRAETQIGTDAAACAGHDR